MGRKAALDAKTRRLRNSTCITETNIPTTLSASPHILFPGVRAKVLDLYNKMKCTYDKLRHITKQNENFYQSTNFVDLIDVIVLVVESAYFLGHQMIVLYA